MKLLLALALLSSAALAENVSVEVVATHSVTNNARDGRAVADKAFLGVQAIERQTESFNLDAIIKGEHVLLSCEDSKGCEAPANGTYEAEVKRGKFVHMKFAVPLAEKPVTRWYKVAGSW